jgi:RNA polymerase sigma factor (sigma-70 family)
MPSSTPSTDAELVGAARNGDPAAWKALLERHDHLLRAICRAHRLSEPDIADVKQITWLRALEHLDRLQDPARIGAWLATVARHECLRILRQAARVQPCDDEVLQRRPDGSAGPDAGLLASERNAAVTSAVSALPQRDRALLGLLYGDEGRSYADIGRTLRMPIGSIGPTRGRVLERLRRHESLAGLAAAA